MVSSHMKSEERQRSAQLQAPQVEQIEELAQANPLSRSQSPADIPN